MAESTELWERPVWDQRPRPQRIGLALGGGMARGMAHIGVLQVLEEHGIRPSYIAGTSAGALVGGLYAAGLDADQIYQLARKLRWNMLGSAPVQLTWSALSAMSMPLGILGLDRLPRWLDEVLGLDVDFAQLRTPFAALATDITTGEMVVMNEGALAIAIRASCSVPGIFTPVRRGGRLLVDGGASNNLPVSVVKQMGADYIIGVDLLPFSDEGPIEPRNILEVSMTALFTLIRTAQRDMPLADCLIQPAIAHFSLSDLTAVEELVAAGRGATEANLPRLLADLGRPTPANG